VEEQREKQRRKILVIDDNPTFGRVLERFFSRQEFDVTHVVEAEEALKVLAQSDSHIDLVICDIHMPKMDGHEFLKRLKAMPEHADLPVIMLTSDNDIEVKLKLLGNGADALLTKNEDPRLLCSHVKSLLSRRRIDQAVK
jgi:CheY-like chemotaxis protein